MTTKDEAARQRELDIYRVVDSLPEPAYEDIGRMASLAIGTPIALVSFVDRDRQWLKAQQGLGFKETPRSIAFCDHAIRTPDRIMEVPDATRDPRFESNPLVTAPNGIRFYAGMPLVTPSGAAIGTVCVIDDKPRTLDETQRAALAALARITMNLLEARHRERELERQLLLLKPAAPEPEAPPPDLAHCRVAIFEVQDFAGAVQRLGHRAVERNLDELQRAFEATLRKGSGDTVSRVSESAELIVVLHGTVDETAEPLRKLLDIVPVFEGNSGLRVLSAHGASESAHERLEMVYLRADEALTLERDAYRAGLGTG
jgi:hypothetical protein